MSLGKRDKASLHPGGGGGDNPVVDWLPTQGERKILLVNPTEMGDKHCPNVPLGLNTDFNFTIGKDKD